MIAGSEALERVLRGDLCAGCGLCEATSAPGRIEMAISADGYLRPRLLAPLSDAEEEGIAATCPGLGVSQEHAGEARVHPLWGAVIAVRTGHAADPGLRFHASSGGALSAILVSLLERGEVDRVVQIAASPNRPIENLVTESRTPEQIFAAAGSRYAPSAPLVGFCERLERPGRFAFVGKPCDVAAVRALARRDPRVAEKVPFLISFFCAGIPSLAGTKEILARLGASEEQLAAFRFRGDGWPGAATATLKSGEVRSMSYRESWGDILSNHIQFRCKICADSVGGGADLVCADAWYGDASGYPSFAEADGRSLILTRTAKGEEALLAAEREGFLETQPLAITEIAKMQPSQARRKTLILSRLAALALLARPYPRYRGLRLARAALMAGPWSHLRSFLGLARRVLLRPRAVRPPVAAAKAPAPR